MWSHKIYVAKFHKKCNAVSNLKIDKWKSSQRIQSENIMNLFLYFSSPLLKKNSPFHLLLKSKFYTSQSTYTLKKFSSRMTPLNYFLLNDVWAIFTMFNRISLELEQSRRHLEARMSSRLTFSHWIWDTLQSLDCSNFRSVAGKLFQWESLWSWSF